MMDLEESPHTLMIRKICATRTLSINRTSYIVHRKLATAFSNAVALGCLVDKQGILMVVHALHRDVASA